MKLTIDRLRFLKLLNTVNIAIVPKSPTPAYLNYKLEMRENELVVIGSNGELTISSSCPVQENDKNYIAFHSLASYLGLTREELADFPEMDE